MYEQIENACYASEIAEFLRSPLRGADCVVLEPRSVNSLRDNCVIFVDNIWCKDFDYGQLDRYREVVMITDRDVAAQTPCPFILTPSPRVDFIRVLNRFFVRPNPAGSHPSAVVEHGAVIGGGVSIGAHAFVGAEVEVGEGTSIHQNAVISGKVRIGRRCVIKANATVGSEGFSFVFDRDNNLEHFPQIGEIVIGDEVWIGANATVERGTLDETRIGDGVKIDDLVQVGHNVRIGKNTRIAAGAVICGRAVIGENCWIAPHACVDNAVVVGDGALVGMGAVALRPVAAGSVVVGVPAKFLRNR